MAELAEELFEVLVKGPGPYGFRLYGGDGDPLIVAKLRARSKAHDAGLREGDVVLGINGRSCQAMSHGIAMTLLESAEDSLRLHLFRGSTDLKSLSAAYGAVGNQLRPVSPGTAPPNRSIFTIQPSPATGAEPPAPVLSATSNGDGPTGAEQVTSYSRQEVTSIDARIAQRTTTETRDLGGVTLTKVTREVVKGQDGGTTWAPTAESYKGHRSTVFHVPKVKAHPMRWAPEGSATSGHFEVNKSITFELDGKEKSAPNNKGDFGQLSNAAGEPHQFKVYKTTAKRWVWQASNVPSLPVREPSPSPAFEVLEPREFQPPHKLEDEFSSGHLDEREGTESSDPFALNPHLIHVLTTEGTQEDFTLGRKKKIFADSSFYDDPEQKYPTIEEQIKMARRVALSLSASDNVTARGQRMFLKRKEKANLWSTDQSLDGLNPYLPTPRAASAAVTPRPRKTAKQHQDLYYNPTPWNAPHTGKVERAVSEAMREFLDGYPEDPGASTAAFAKNRELFEKGVEFQSGVREPPWKKALSNSSQAPQLCVGLAHDLRGMKGKGAKLFAQRRAKAFEEEEEEEAEWQSEGEAIGSRRRNEEHHKHETPEPTDPREASARRLEELISISKSCSSPWESKAAANQTVLTPWRTAAPVTHAVERQATADDIPSFIAKKTPSSSYRPVKFRVPSNGPRPRITDLTSNGPGPGITDLPLNGPGPGITDF